MAKVAKTFPARAARQYFSKLDAWLDGQIWRLEVGEDVTDDAELENLRRSLYRRGKQRGLRVKITREDQALVVQGSKPEGAGASAP